MFSSRMLLWNKTYCVCSEKDRAPRIVDVAQKDSKGNNKNETTSSANVRLKFNILERKKKRKKNYLHCVLYKIYIYDPLSYLIFFICVLDPIWYPLITKSFEWMTSFRNYTNMNDKRTFLILRPLHALIQTSWGFRFQGSFIDTVNALNETVLPWAELVPFVLATPSVKLSYFEIALRGIMCISGTLHD